MAADDEFPRSWEQQASALGANAQVVYPAIPNIAWVITSAQATGTSGYTGVYVLQLEINNVQYAVGNGNASAGGDADLTVSWDGEPVFPVNTAVTILAAETGSLNVLVIATAYPI